AKQEQDGCGLARAVGSEKAEDLALLHRKVDPVDSGDASVALDEALRLDHRAHRRPYRVTAKPSTTTAAAITPSPATPHTVAVRTVTRKLALSETPSPLARTVTT